MGMPTWPDDGTVRAPSREEAILSELELELNKTTPEFEAAMEKWSTSTDEGEIAQYSAYKGFERLASPIYTEKSGLLDLLAWNRNVPEYVKAPQETRRVLFGKARCAINETPFFQIGCESKILKGGLGDFIIPPNHYDLFERREFIWRHMGVRTTRVKLGDKRLKGEAHRHEPHASDLLARSFLYHWMQGLEKWLRSCDFTEFWAWPSGIQPEKRMNIGEIMEVEWGLFWDELGAVVWEYFRMGSYDEYMVLSLIGVDTTFEIDETNPELVKSSPASEVDKQAFSTRKIIYASAFNRRRRPVPAELALGFPMVRRPRAPPSLPPNNPSRHPTRWDTPPWVTRG